jgi:cytochrome d ubiquinol oxidase subunit II
MLLFLVAYSVFDGFDLGLGMLTLFTKGEEKRNHLFSALAPFWDGNELWLIMAGASLFAVFPQAFATALSNFYVPIFIIAVALMLRAAAFECRHHCRRAATRRAWEATFALASLLIPLLLAVALGNIIVGLPLTGPLAYNGSILFLLRPYPLALAVAGIALIVLQGSLFAACKLPAPFSGELRSTASRWWYIAVVAFVLLAGIMPCMLPAARSLPYAAAAAIAVLALGAAKIFVRRARDRSAFYASSLAVIAVWLMQAAALFPNLIRDTADPAASITIFSASAGLSTLRVLTGIAIPCTVLYLALNWFLYRAFRGKLLQGKDFYGTSGK